MDEKTEVHLTLSDSLNLNFDLLHVPDRIRFLADMKPQLTPSPTHPLTHPPIHPSSMASDYLNQFKLND